MVQESCYKLITEEMTHLEAELFCSDNETASLVAETTPLHVITYFQFFAFPTTIMHPYTSKYSRFISMAN